MKKILKLIKKHKKKLLLLALLSALLIIFLPHLAFAQDAAPAPTTSSTINEMYSKLVNFMILIMELLRRMLLPILLLIGGLLKNDILFSAGMEDVMLAIWGNIRNIVNILFVLILLGIAFYNVLGGSSQDYHLKTILPKFIIALIAVNFSFVAGKVVLDGVNVVTTAIFALPGAVQRDLVNPATPAMQKSFCEFFHGKDKYATSLLKAEEVASESTPVWCTGAKTFSDKGKEFFTKFDSANAGIAISVNLLQLNLLDTVEVTESSVKELAINVLFSTILFIVYGVSFVALLVILLGRLVVIWMGMILSPLMALAFVLPESLMSKMGGEGDLKTKFVQNVIVPIPIALVMSIGFIMMQALRDVKFGQITGSMATSSMGVGLLTSGLDTLQELLVAVGVIAFIWMGVFAAAKGSIAEGVVGRIKGAAEGFGVFLAKAPFQYAPIIPVGEGGEKVSLGAAYEAMKRLPGSYDQKMNEEVERITKKYGGGTSAIEITNELSRVTTAKGARQGVVDIVASGVPGDTGFQRGLAERMKSSAEIQRGIMEDLRRAGAVNVKTGKAYTPEEFKTELEAGKVPPEVMKKLSQYYTTRQGFKPTPRGEAAPGTKPPPEPTATGAGRRGGGGVPSTPVTSEVALRDNAKKAAENAVKEAISKGNDRERIILVATAAVEKTGISSDEARTIAEAAANAAQVSAAPGAAPPATPPPAPPAAPQPTARPPRAPQPPKPEDDFDM
ncbi:hypothetical protein KJ951_04420 [Patescibacteria group bacterium]|nr:hypothetical protein [Patescibacteria group bacterium]MBU1703623.1 hypothetical protein [Patescibacteria group bacterium]MBU1953915.1 hypothetical protein [Patescibacteria group bacterium]